MDHTPSFDGRFSELAALAYQVAFRLVGDQHAAENHAQEAMARALLARSKIGSCDQAWVVRVTTNLEVGRSARARCWTWSPPMRSPSSRFEELYPIDTHLRAMIVGGAGHLRATNWPDFEQLVTGPGTRSPGCARLDARGSGPGARGSGLGAWGADGSITTGSRRSPGPDLHHSVGLTLACHKGQELHHHEVNQMPVPRVGRTRQKLDGSSWGAECPPGRGR